MPCLVGFGVLLFPRVALVLVWFFGDGWLQSVFDTLLWPVLGFLFLPLTTLAYAGMWHSGGGSIDNVGMVVISIAALIDLGLLGGGSASARSS